MNENRYHIVPSIKTIEKSYACLWLQRMSELEEPDAPWFYLQPDGSFRRMTWQEVEVVRRDTRSSYVADAKLYLEAVYNRPY